MKNALKTVMIFAGAMLAIAAAACLLIGYWERVEKWLCWLDGAARELCRKLRTCCCCHCGCEGSDEEHVDASCFAD